MNYFVYSFEHVYKDDTHTACKFLGYFDDLQKLEKAKENAVTLPGFSTYPGGLIFKKRKLNKTHWQNGFDSVAGEIGRDYLEKEDEIDEDSKSIKELNLKYIYQVSHSYTIHTFLDDERIIGVFLNENKANEIVDHLKKEKGFSDREDDFILSEFILNEQLWTSGF